MAVASIAIRTRPTATARSTTEPFFVKALLIAVAVGFVGLFLVMPLVVVFAQALEKGLGAYFAALREPMTLAALKLTLLAAAIAVPLNLVFGLAAAWAIAKFDFPGKSAADHADRPAVRGLAGHLGHDLRAALRPRRAGSAPGWQAHDIKIVFAVPGIVLATIFVTFPSWRAS